MALADTQRDDEAADPLATVDQHAPTRAAADRPRERPHELCGQAKGRYVPLRPHAKGGLGEVFVARDRGARPRGRCSRRFRSGWPTTPRNRARFIREAEITGQPRAPRDRPDLWPGPIGRRPPLLRDAIHRRETLAAAIDRFHSSVEPIHAPGERVGRVARPCCGGSTTSATPSTTPTARGSSIAT